MGTLFVDAMSAVDDFESFAFFMGTVDEVGAGCRRTGEEIRIVQNGQMDNGQEYIDTGAENTRRK